MKKRAGPLANAHRVMFCCGGEDSYSRIGCLRCTSVSMDQISDVSKASATDFISKTNKSPLDKIADAVCLIQHSPFRILRIAEQGNVKEFTRLITADLSKLNVRDSRGRASVHQATIRNHVPILEVVVSFNGNLDLTDNHGNNCMHLAVEVEALEALEFLLANGADTKKLNERSQSPLHMAAEMNKVNALKVMAKFRDALDPNLPGEHGRTALHLAAINDHEECMKILAVELCLRSGAKISTQQHDLSTPVHLACSQGSMDIIKLMFQLQPEEKETCLKSCDVQRKTALHYASMFDHHSLVEFLIEQGATINVLDKERRTPLLLAASRNGWKTVKTLIRLGANITLKDNDSRNVLQTIVINGGDLDKILDDEFCPDFVSILEERDKNGYTALHYAAKLGHIKTAARLLQLGSSIITKNNDGENVFHIACRFGRLNIIHRILKMEQSNSVINEGDGKGLTALHIASSEGHVRVVQSLIKKGALLHRDHTGNTPLHHASARGHRETMKLILNVHSHLLDQTDKDGNTPLHVAAMESQPTAVEFLLVMNCTLTYNFNGFSAIDFALQNKFAAVSLVMVTHRTRGDEILSMKAGKHPSVMLALIATMPQVVTALLDRCITKSDAKSDSELYHIKYDFKWLDLAGTDTEQLKSKASSGVKYKGYTETKYLPILNGMVSYGRVELLSHDLSQKYLQMKWSGYGRFVHLTQLLLYLVFLTILTSYASNYSRIRSGNPEEGVSEGIHLQNFLPDDPLISRNGSIFNDSAIQASYINYNMSDWGKTIMETTHTNKLGEAIQAVLIFSIALVCLLRESVNICRQKLKYALDSSNWVFWAMNIACVIMTSSKVISGLDDLANPSASLATFLSWFYLLLFLQRFDVVGIYVVMFLEILHTLLRVLMIFSILIVAFGLAFYILLSNANHRAFQEVPISLMRTFSMMLGDMDFMNTFVNPHYCVVSDSKKPDPIIRLDGQFDYEDHSSKGCTGKDRKLPHPISSFLMLGIFMVLMPILLMNLLIGLAVGDIESVRRNAQLKRLAMQVHLHTALEKTLPKFILKTVDKKEVIEYPNASKARLGLIDNFFKYFQPKSSHKGVDTDSVEEELTDDLMSAVTQNNETLTNVSARLENLETLMRLLCHKMELSTDTDFIDEGTQVDDGGSLMSDMKSRFKRGVTIRLTKTTKRPPGPVRSDSSNL